ncbi:MAG: 30S ribosomal protein S24e [Methanocellales archaeon]|nr:30S ribosomal protein S24e [Methanocellales archaeon]
MEIKVIEKKTNPLLKRQEIWFDVHHEGPTPAREDVKNKLAAMLNAEPTLVIIERMRSEYGRRRAHGYAKLYKSKKQLDSIERAYIIQRNAPKVEEAEKKVEVGKEGARPEEVKEKAEAPKEKAAKVEKPEEEKKVEGKAEEVKEESKGDKT